MCVVKGERGINSETESEGSDESNAPGKKKNGSGSLHREMNLVDAIGLFVGVIIGSGIFITPASILEEAGSFAVSMICWVVGVIIATFGALCFIELGLLIPRTGAEYIYILHGFSFKKYSKWTELLGSLLAFLYTWTSILIIEPASLSIKVLTCARYLTRPLYTDCEIPLIMLKCLALSILGRPSYSAVYIILYHYA